MKRSNPLRELVVDLLTGGGAHASLRDVVSSFPAALRDERVPGCPHTAWELLEHMRIAQHDLLEYSVVPGFESPPWPEGYWPTTPAQPEARAWAKSVRELFADQRELLAIVRDRKRDLLAPLAHAPDTSLLLELFLVASHNSYHLGQLMLLRRTLESSAARASANRRKKPRASERKPNSRTK
jgi:hypothetical protein